MIRNPFQPPSKEEYDKTLAEKFDFYVVKKTELEDRLEFLLSIIHGATENGYAVESSIEEEVKTTVGILGDLKKITDNKWRIRGRTSSTSSTRSPSFHWDYTLEDTSGRREINRVPTHTIFYEDAKKVYRTEDGEELIPAFGETNHTERYVINGKTKNGKDYTGTYREYLISSTKPVFEMKWVEMNIMGDIVQLCKEGLVPKLVLNIDEALYIMTSTRYLLYPKHLPLVSSQDKKVKVTLKDGTIVWIHPKTLAELRSRITEEINASKISVISGG